MYYKTTHGFGPGTVPPDIAVIEHFEAGMIDILKFERELTEKEASCYDLRKIDEDTVRNLVGIVEN